MLASLLDSGGFFCIAMPIGAIFFACGFAWGPHRTQRIVAKWAGQNGYRLLACEHRLVLRGPFLWTLTRRRITLRVTMETPDGRIAKGWVSCAAWPSELGPDQIQVQWDPEKPEPPGFPVILREDQPKRPE